MRSERNGTYRRVRKDVARKIYNNGGSVYMLPENIRLDNAWISPMEMSGSIPFSDYVNAYEFYNCLNSETGKKAKFFVADA